MESLGNPISTGILTAGSTAAQTVTQPKPSGSKVSNTLDTITKVVDSATGLVTAVKGGGSTPGYDPAIATTQYQPGSSPLPQAKDNTKWFLLAGGVALAGIVIYAIAKKKK